MNSIITRMLKKRSVLLLLILIITPIGFATKFYSGPAAGWVNNSFGGMLYIVFWCLIARAIFPKANSAILASSVFWATTIIEFLQLWHPPSLEWARGFFIGRTFLGNSFSWTDILHYAIASLIMYPILKYFGENRGTKTPSPN